MRSGDRAIARGCRAGVAALLLLAATAAAAEELELVRQRRAMVEEIVSDARATGAQTGRGRLAPEVLAALGRVPRHEFVSAALRPHAYDNRPLPIGYGQTISQPYIVGLMTDLLDLGETARVLEVGTGSGYQAAVLAELTPNVATIEIVPELAAEARARLARLGYGAVAVRHGDGYGGWPEKAPFDGILVAAAASHIPPPLVAQLAPGGRMVIPVGGPFSVQQLMLVSKEADGAVRTRALLPVSFVPLTGDH